jgi:uncharacterized protein VirK/YbjX
MNILRDCGRIPFLLYGDTGVLLLVLGICILIQLLGLLITVPIREDTHINYQLGYMSQHGIILNYDVVLNSRMCM